MWERQAKSRRSIGESKFSEAERNDKEDGRRISYDGGTVDLCYRSLAVHLSNIVKAARISEKRSAGRTGSRLCGLTHHEHYELNGQIGDRGDTIDVKRGGSGATNMLLTHETLTSQAQRPKPDTMGYASPMAWSYVVECMYGTTRLVTPPCITGDRWTG